MTNWESRFNTWSSPSSTTEADKMTNAENAIRGAINTSDALKNYPLRVLAHGSYRNNTNVRQNSDVDIMVCCMEPFFDEYPAGLTRADFGIGDAYYAYSQFKSDVQSALVARFGWERVTLGNKAIDVHANTYHVDADVVACFEYRLYTRRGTEPLRGIKFYSVVGEEVINWPDQHHANGVAKNNATNYTYKYLTRIIKRLRYHMAEENIGAASSLSSYFIECLVYNVPTRAFRYLTYADRVREVLAHIYTGTSTQASGETWEEVNGMKYLFPNDQYRQKANDFAQAAWNYIGFT